MKKDLFALLGMVLTISALTIVVSCGENEAVELTADQNDDLHNLIVEDIIVTVDDNGNADGGHNFTKIDEENFYIDDIKYTATKGDLIVTGYYDAFFKGEAKIITTLIYGGRKMDVVRIADNAFKDCKVLSAINIPQSVKRIGYFAFSGCSGLTSITIPKSVIDINDGAFSGCSALTSIQVESGNKMYDSRDNCNAIVKTAENTLIAGCMNTAIPNSVTSIGDYAFQHCSGLTSITIPGSMTRIGYNAFNGCYRLASVTINSNSIVSKQSYSESSNFKTIFGQQVQEYIIGEQVTSIGDNAFYGCGGLTSVTIGNSVTSIGGSAFYGCFGLTSITIPNSVTSIGGSAFYGCSGLTSVTIPNSVTSIGGSAFYDCSSLTSITITNSVTSIGEDTFSGTAWYNKQPDGLVYVGKVAYKYKGTMPDNTTIKIKDGTLSINDGAFKGCSGQASVTIPNSVTSIGNYAFSGCSGLTSVTIPNSVTSIGMRAFSGCSGLTSITIPNSVTSIDYETFDNCSGLTSITIGSGVTSIGDYAFQHCSGLTSITIPGSMTRIGNAAFSGCSRLTDVYCYATTPPQCGYFGKTPMTQLHVPASAIDAYKQAYSWNEFKSIVAIEE